MFAKGKEFTEKKKRGEDSTTIDLMKLLLQIIVSSLA
jgi:hypothetical protein